MDKNSDASKETTRIQSFSDGIFAFAITLLVLGPIATLHPESGAGLIENCIDHWQSFLAYAIGFMTILVCWINHHVALEYLKKVDTKFMWINGSLLFVVTLTPFPTAVLAEYFEKESQTALAIFGFNYVLISVAADRICTYVYNHLIGEEDRAFYYSYKVIYRYGIVYTLIAFLLCFVSIIIPIILYILLFAAFSAPKELALKLFKLRQARKR